MAALGFSLVLPWILCDLLWNCLYLENERVGSDQRFSCCASESPGGTLKKIQMPLQTTRKYRCPGLNPRGTEPGHCNCSELLMCFRGATRFGNHWPGWSLGIFIPGNLVILKQGKGCFQGLYNRETRESKPVLLSTLCCISYQPSTGKEPLWTTKLHKDPPGCSHACEKEGRNVLNSHQ